MVEKPVFEPDETIPTEFCRRVITRVQLREITGYEDVFSFEEIIERNPFIDSDIEICEIRTAVTLGEFDSSLGIAIISPVVDYTVEEQFIEFIEIKDMIIAFGKDVREIEEIGEKVFLVTDPDEKYLLSFIDADIDRIVFAGVSMLEFDYEVALNFAKQVEANLRK